MPLYRHNNGILVRNGGLANGPGCCCGGCPRCVIDGEIDCRYLTEAECEECITTYYCYNPETGETNQVAGCPDCVGGAEDCFQVVEGPCGTWTENLPCGPCPCTSDGDCPNFQQECGDVYPDYPYSCCDGGCLAWACYPGASITLRFRKKAGCTWPFLDGVPEGGEFVNVISGGGLYGCSQSAVMSSAPCLTQWTLSTGCTVTNLTFDGSVTPTCQQCFEFLGWESCRVNCLGVCQ